MNYENEGFKLGAVDKLLVGIFVVCDGEGGTKILTSPYPLSFSSMSTSDNIGNIFIPPIIIS
jgi:hypothetical protein